jgi:hypothetical protein
VYRLDTCWCSRAYRRPAALLRIDIGTLEDELIRYSASIRSMYYLAVCIIASLVLSAHSSAQEFAAEPAIARAAVVLKLAFGIKASHLTILSADRATWGEDGDAMVVERQGPLRLRDVCWRLPAAHRLQSAEHPRAACLWGAIL